MCVSKLSYWMRTLNPERPYITCITNSYNDLNIETTNNDTVRVVVPRLPTTTLMEYSYHVYLTTHSAYSPAHGIFAFSEQMPFPMRKEGMRR